MRSALSLARAFNYAGVPSLVASLWSIPDNSTSKIMTLFYQNLNAGMPKDMALQQAKISYLNDDDLSSPATRLPIHWAAVIALGDMSEVSFSYGSFWPYVITIIAVLIIGWLVFRKRKQV